MANLFNGITDFLSGGQMKDALDRLSRSSQTIYDIKSPELTKLIPELKLQVMQGQMTPAQAGAALAQVQGQMTPEQAQAFLQSDSGMGLVQSDQASLQGQREALSRLEDIGANQGLTEADRAQFQAVMNQQAAKTAQDRAAQIQQLQMQGNAGTGAELAARLSGIQGGANANAAAGADVAKAAQARALAAIQAGLQGNSNLNTQMFEQAAKKAQAQDMVNQFNAQARNTIGLQNAQMRQSSNLANYQTANQMAMANAQAQNAANIANAGYANQANAANFGMANQIAGTNVGIQNQQAMMPYNAAQADFTNQMNRAVAGSTADYRSGSVMADLAGKQMANTTGQLDAFGNLISNVTGGKGTGGIGNALGEIPWGKVAGTVGSVAGDAASGIGDWLGTAWGTVGDWLSDEDLKTEKKELTDADIDKVMGHLTGYQYRYKGNKNPKQVGVMAQDMPENSTVETPAGKMIQKPEALNMALAALANQHQRLKKLEGNK